MVKARIIDAEGDLVFAAIEVPMTDKRPAINPAAIRQEDKVGHGNPEGESGANTFRPASL